MNSDQTVMWIYAAGFFPSGESPLTSKEQPLRSVSVGLFSQIGDGAGYVIVGQWRQARWMGPAYDSG